VTHGVRQLESRGAAFAVHEYRYVDHGGTAEAARQLGVDEHAVIKTLVLGETPKAPFLVLMHGDAEVSVRALARAMGVKSVAPCPPAVAERVTGYQVGGISPFGTRQPLPVLVEATVLDLPRLYVNGGRRGLLVSMTPAQLTAVLQPRVVHVALPAPPAPRRPRGGA
jgi:Cys-tRNA(Pro) deacylase